MPWRISLRILERIEAADANLCLIKHGDHRLSREPDIELLIRTVETLLARL